MTSLLGLEDANTGREAMEKVGTANRTDFTVAEETGDRHGTGGFGNHAAIMIRLAVQVNTAAITGKEERPPRWLSGRG